jgi:hypothetical protein
MQCTIGSLGHLIRQAPYNEINPLRNEINLLREIRFLVVFI